jgi:hypothetical protein
VVFSGFQGYVNKEAAGSHFIKKSKFKEYGQEIK